MQDLLAKSLDAPSVQTFRKRFPYYEMVQDEERGTVVFKHDDELTYSPEELLAMILTKCKEMAAEFAGEYFGSCVKWGEGLVCIVLVLNEEG